MEPDWQHLDPSVVADQLTAFDHMRRTCPVAFSEDLGWSLFRHADVAAVLADHGTFSSDVSEHLSVPNGMDPPDHTRFRRLLDPYFTPARVEGYAASFRAIAAELVADLPDGDVEVMAALGHPFAARVQCAFMGWLDEPHGSLRAWTDANQEATRQQDRERLAELAEQFDHIIRAELDQRRDPDAHADDNLLYGAGIHVCPGAPLARRELEILVEELLAGTEELLPAGGPRRAHYPAGGYTVVPVRVVKPHAGG